MLTEFDEEPWHYLLLNENASEGREDIKWWEQRSSAEIAHVLKHHEGLPLYVETKASGLPPPMNPERAATAVSTGCRRKR